MNKPKEFWINKKLLHVVQDTKPVSHEILPNEWHHVIEKFTYDKAIDVLKEIADQDFRGNRPNECVMAYKFLKEIGEIT